MNDLQLYQTQGDLSGLQATVAFHKADAAHHAQRVTLLEGEVTRLRDRQGMMEDGTIRLLMERLDKVEDRLAEKDEEIAILRGQVRPSC